MARTSLVDYQETVWSRLYPGNRHTVRCLEPAVLATETALELSSQRRQRVVWRLDGGAGTDDKLRWLLKRGYHILAKGFSGRRADNLAAQVTRWDSYGDAWLAEVPLSVDLGRPVRCFIKRRPMKGKLVHSFYVSTLGFPSKAAFLQRYDARGRAEVEQFRQDKSGLALAARRKSSFIGQQALIALTDLAHNLLAHFQQRALAGSPLASFGPKRIVRDLFQTPGRLTFDDQNRLVRVDIISQKQFSTELAICLEKYSKVFDS